jgi:hypothetical protein
MGNKRGAFRKHDRNVQNVVARHQYLVDAIDDPKKLKGDLKSFLLNQRAFASFSLINSPIETISLNTLKSVSNDLYKDEIPLGGFKYFDGLRITLMKIVYGDASSIKPSKRQISNVELLNLQERIRQAELLNLHRSNAYLDLYRHIVALADSEFIDNLSKAKLNRLIEDHRSSFWCLFAPENPMFSDKLRIVSPS